MIATQIACHSTFKKWRYDFKHFKQYKDFVSHLKFCALCAIHNRSYKKYLNISNTTHIGFLMRKIALFILQKVHWLREIQLRSKYLILRQINTSLDFQEDPIQNHSFYITSFVCTTSYTNKFESSFLLWGGFLIFNHLNRRLDLVRPCLDPLFRRLRFRCLNLNSPKGDQSKAAPIPIVYFQFP